jgi:hypothetical protein
MLPSPCPGRFSRRSGGSSDGEVRRCRAQRSRGGSRSPALGRVRARRSGSGGASDRAARCVMAGPCPGKFFPPQRRVVGRRIPAVPSQARRGRKPPPGALRGGPRLGKSSRRDGGKPRGLSPAQPRREPPAVPPGTSASGYARSSGRRQAQALRGTPAPPGAARHKRFGARPLLRVPPGTSASGYARSSGCRQAQALRGTPAPPGAARHKRFGARPPRPATPGAPPPGPAPAGVKARVANPSVRPDLRRTLGTPGELRARRSSESRMSRP